MTAKFRTFHIELTAPGHPEYTQHTDDIPAMTPTHALSKFFIPANFMRLVNNGLSIQILVREVR